MSEQINWDDATGAGRFVQLTDSEPSTLVLTNWRLEKVEKFGDTKWEFQADCIEENSEIVEKLFNTTSNRLKKKLRAVFENKVATDKTKVVITKIGDGFETAYSVKEITA